MRITVSFKISDLMFEPGMSLLEELVEDLRVLLDGNLQRQNLLAVRIEEECVGLSDFLAYQVDAVQHLRHGIDDLRRRNHYVAKVAQAYWISIIDLFLPIRTVQVCGRPSASVIWRTDVCVFDGRS